MHLAVKITTNIAAIEYHAKSCSVISVYVFFVFGKVTICLPDTDQLACEKFDNGYRVFSVELGIYGMVEPVAVGGAHGSHYVVPK